MNIQKKGSTMPLNNIVNFQKINFNSKPETTVLAKPNEEIQLHFDAVLIRGYGNPILDIVVDKTNQSHNVYSLSTKAVGGGCGYVAVYDNKGKEVFPVNMQLSFQRDVTLQAPSESGIYDVFAKYSGSKLEDQKIGQIVVKD